MSGPIDVYPANPHYFRYRGSPLFLITSDHHYGAVVNAEFDYAAFLDRLAAKGLNFTRIYPGAYIERENEYVAGNPLGPRDGRQILPWARTGNRGAHPVLGGFRYDLDAWDPAYFGRLRDFCARAQDRGIIVEICYFNGMYAERWPFQAMFSENNVQGVGRCAWDMVQSLTGDPALVAYQERYVAELAARLNEFDNLIFHICDEPWMGRRPAGVFGPWMERMIEAFLRSEAELPKRHLLGQTVDWRMRDNAADLSADDRIQYIDIEYARGADDLEREYAHGKPVVYIESVFYPQQYGGRELDSSRVEAWEFMVGGAAGFMQLNCLFTTSDATAKDAEAMLDSLGILRRFLEDSGFAANRRDTSLPAAIPAGVFTSASSVPGEQYALYLHHSAYQDPPPRPDDPGSFRHSYRAIPGQHQGELTLELPAGEYSMEWIDPATGSIARKEQFSHQGGSRSVRVPCHTVDIAMRLRAVTRR